MAARALLLAGGVLTAACASPRVPPSASPTRPGASSSCLIASDSSAPGDSGATRTVTAVFDDQADAVRARRAALLAAPVRLDCEGRPFPGLAVAWARDTSGRFWTLELREPEAADSNERWTAAALAATWRADPDASAALQWAGVTSLVPIDARRLVVGFSAPASELPTLFADRALGVAGADARPGLEPATPDGDLRDVIDRGPDLVHTDDPDLLEYARGRPGLAVVPLPWNRTYLLVLPEPDAAVAGWIPADTAGFRRALARDAVRTDARVPEPPVWWNSPAACARAGTPAGGRPRLNAIAFPAGDRVARDLAERLVAVAGVDGLTARELPADSFAAVLRAGAARAYVLGVDKHAAIACREMADWPPQATAMALIETRPHAILRRGAPPLVVEWDGALRPATAVERSAGGR